MTDANLIPSAKPITTYLVIMEKQMQLISLKTTAVAVQKCC